MLIPLSWLKEFVDIKLPFLELAKRLSEAGLTVEKWDEREGDIIFDPEVTPNRPDWLSVYGIAREIAAITKEKLQVKRLRERKLSAQSAQSEKLEFKTPKSKLPIEIKPDYKLAPRLTAVILSGVKITESPVWLQKRIKQIGLRPINNLVDISNYIMWEQGSPLHIFDYDLIRGHEMTLSSAKGTEEFRSLDGITYKLPQGAITFKDLGRVIDLCGIKGGENTAVKETTKKILILVPIYNPLLIRRASQGLNLRSDASGIFEKGADFGNTINALNRTVELVQNLAGGEMASELIDLKETADLSWTIQLSHDHLESVVGIKFDPKNVREIFERLGLTVNIKVTAKDNKVDPTMIVPLYEVSIPSHRSDLRITEDLIEEVVRINGFNNLPKTLPAGEISTEKVAHWFDFDLMYEVKSQIAALGYNEIYTYSLVSKKHLELLDIDPPTALHITNPISADYEYLRPHLLGNLLEATKLNMANNSEVKLFELGKVYEGANIDSVIERYSLAAVWTGEKYLEAKGELEVFLQKLGIKATFLPPENVSGYWLHPGRTAAIMVDTQRIGMIGEVHPELLGKFGITNRVTEWTLKYDQLVPLIHKAKLFQPIPKYAVIVEDYTFTLPEQTYVGPLFESIKNLDPHIIGVELASFYQNNLSVRVHYTSLAKNLTDKDILPTRKKIAEAGKQFNATLVTK